MNIELDTTTIAKNMSKAGLFTNLRRQRRCSSQKLISRLLLPESCHCLWRSLSWTLSEWFHTKNSRLQLRDDLGWPSGGRRKNSFWKPNFHNSRNISIFSAYSFVLLTNQRRFFLSNFDHDIMTSLSKVATCPQSFYHRVVLRCSHQQLPPDLVVPYQLLWRCETPGNTWLRVEVYNISTHELLLTWKVPANLCKMCLERQDEPGPFLYVYILELPVASLLGAGPQHKQVDL